MIKRGQEVESELLKCQASCKVSGKEARTEIWIMQMNTEGQRLCKEI